VNATQTTRQLGGEQVGPRAQQLPRLLPPELATGPTSLAEHLARSGPLPAVGRDRRSRQELIAQVQRSGLTGRGGAGFPTGRKLAAVAAGRNAVVVANGTEGEPASGKDKVLLARSPHLVLDGAAVAAELVDARRVVIVVHHAVREIVDAAVAERRRARIDRVPVKVVTAADRFVAGEASAVVHWVEGGRPIPTRRPPRLSEKGLGGRPTLVQNVETLAHLALIARRGADWFRAIGTAQEPGSMLVTVLGAVREPLVVEIAIGTPIQDLIGLAGGASRPLQALLLGGYFGSWVSSETAAPLPFSSAGLADTGADLGAGLVAALPADACGLVETARVVRYLADESAGQCGACVFGLAAVAGELDRIVHSGTADLSTLHRWLGQIDGRGACSLPDGAVRLIRSALTVFERELHQHARGRCSATATASVLPIPPRRQS
jgi:NADH:ubiquinone oxidoreductase subunit F (NADH-binding)